MGAGRDLVAMRKDGSEFTAEVGLRPVKLKDGAVILASICIDVSERRANEKVLRSEERLRAVIENAVDGVVTIDEAGIMQSANPAAEKVFGYSATELIGRNISMLMPDPIDRGMTATLPTIRTGEAKIIGHGREVTGRRKDGSTFPMDTGGERVSCRERALFHRAYPRYHRAQRGRGAGQVLCRGVAGAKCRVPAQ